MEDLEKEVLYIMKVYKVAEAYKQLTHKKWKKCLDWAEDYVATNMTWCVNDYYVK